MILIPDRFKSVRIDVGLSVNAPQSQIWLDKDSELLVFGFEPVSANLKSIKSGVSSWPVNLDPTRINNSIYIINCALLEKALDDGKIIYVTKNDPGCSSVLKPKNFEVAYEEKVNVSTLNTFLDYFPFTQIPYISHLKIDVQGADIQVIEGATNYLSKIMAITAEVDTNEYSGTRNSLQNISDLLKPHGFVLCKKDILSRILLRLKGIRIKNETDDPTFINIALYKKHKPTNFWIYQRG